MKTYRAVFKVVGMPAKFVIEILADHMTDAIDMVDALSYRMDIRFGLKEKPNEHLQS